MTHRRHTYRLYAQSSVARARGPKVPHTISRLVTMGVGLAVLVNVFLATDRAHPPPPGTRTAFRLVAGLAPCIIPYSNDLIQAKSLTCTGE